MSSLSQESTLDISSEHSYNTYSSGWTTTEWRQLDSGTSKFYNEDGIAAKSPNPHPIKKNKKRKEMSFGGTVYQKGSQKITHKGRFSWHFDSSCTVWRLIRKVPCTPVLWGEGTQSAGGRVFLLWMGSWRSRESIDTWMGRQGDSPRWFSP